jgi:hypothetical protein
MSHDPGIYSVTSPLWLMADESGIDQRRDVICAIGGYLAPPDIWLAFSLDWRTCLENFEVKAFHAGRFFNRDPQGNRLDEYRGWSEAKALAFLHELTEVISRHPIRQIASGVENAAFMNLSIGERRLLTGGRLHAGTSKSGAPIWKWNRRGAPSRPYYLVFQECIRRAIQMSDDETTVNFILDRQQVLQKHAIRLFEDIAAGYRLTFSLPQIAARRLGTISYENSSNWAGLQAADLRAHLWYHSVGALGQIPDVLPDATNFPWQNVTLERRLAINLLRKQGEQMLVMYDRRALEETLSGITPDQRARVRADES